MVPISMAEGDLPAENGIRDSRVAGERSYTVMPQSKSNGRHPDTQHTFNRSRHPSLGRVPSIRQKLP